jgi:D-beta-D-heptose 7-phosphate kinase/D-beta-D-heptose 1-phosphate adenosyltransferase
VTLPPIAAARARQILARLPEVRVLVAGDLMLDRFIVGRVTRISPEAPVPVVRYESEHTRLGGAANVAHNLAALGARPWLVGVAGRDSAGSRLRDLLRGAGIGADGLVEDPARPTVEKVRIVTERNQQVARIDYENDADVDGAVEAQLLERIAAAADEAQVILVSDYLKGVVTPGLMARLARMKEAGLPLIVDPKIPHLAHYAGASLITPNHHEAEAATHLRIRSDDDARRAGLEFRARARCDAALITRGEHGMWLSAPGVEGSVAAAAREVADVTGAGDTVAAMLAAAVGAGATLAEAAALANQAAAVVVGRFGPATVTPAEVLGLLSA